MIRRPQRLFPGVSEPDAGAVVEVPRQILVAELVVVSGDYRFAPEFDTARGGALVGSGKVPTSRRGH